MSNVRFNSFREFYPFYLQEHSNITCRRLHFVGTSLVIALIVTAIVSGQWALLWALPLVGYGFAWVGHFFLNIIGQPHSSTRSIAWLAILLCIATF